MAEDLDLTSGPVEDVDPSADTEVDFMDELLQDDLPDDDGDDGLHTDALGGTAEDLSVDDYQISEPTSCVLPPRTSDAPPPLFSSPPTYTDTATVHADPMSSMAASSGPPLTFTFSSSPPAPSIPPPPPPPVTAPASAPPSAQADPPLVPAASAPVSAPADPPPADGEPGGPRVDTLLTSYATHVARRIWAEPTWTKVIRVWSRNTRPLDQFRPFMQGGPDSWWGLAQRSGLTGLVNLRYGATDHILISAYAEHWYPETNTFHFPWGEITVTLHDVHRITGVPIDGDPLISPLTVDQTQDRLAEMLDLDPETARKWRTRAPSATIASILRDMLSGTRAAPPATIATLFLWYFLGMTIFVDKSGTSIRTWILAFLFDHDRTGRYAWGAGILAGLFRELGMTSRMRAAGCAGCALLLRTWIQSYFEHTRGRVILDLGRLGDDRAAARIATDRAPNQDAERLLAMRRVLDTIRAEEIRWMPWGSDMTFDGAYQVSRFRGILVLHTIQEAYHPERCLRQYSRIQTIPPPPFQPSFFVRNEDLANASYRVSYSPEDHHWAERMAHLIQLAPQRAEYAWQVEPGYLAWFRDRSHVYVDPTSPHQDDPRPPVVHPIPAVTDRMRVQHAAGYARDQLRQLPLDDPARPHLIHMLSILDSDAPPPPPPMPTRGRLFRDSQNEPGSGSGASHERET